MFKRLSKARALQEQLEDQVDESEPVTLEAALDEDSASESDVGSDDDDDESDEDVEDEDVEDEDEQEKFTVRQALKSPIYLDDEAQVRAQIFRCVACPLVQLRNEKSIEVHQDSKVRLCLIQAHKRRYARFIQFAESESRREGERVMQLDPRSLADLLEDERRAEEKAAEHKVGFPLTQRKEADTPSKPHTSRVERRKQRRAVRKEKRAGLQEAYAKRVAGEKPAGSERPPKRQK